MEDTTVIPDPKFEEFFPILFKKLNDIPTLIEKVKEEYNPPTSHDLYDCIWDEIFEPCKKEIEKVLGGQLQEMLEWGNLVIHTILVIYQTMTDERFSKLSPVDQNILLWASLLHDIAKRGKKAFEGKDHVHPFWSAAVSINILVGNEIGKHSVTIFRHQYYSIWIQRACFWIKWCHSKFN